VLSAPRHWESVQQMQTYRCLVPHCSIPLLTIAARTRLRLTESANQVEPPPTTGEPSNPTSTHIAHTASLTVTTDLGTLDLEAGYQVEEFNYWDEHENDII
jgi:hypothetical protein